MGDSNPGEATARFAKTVVRELRAAGFQALFAGGCVRDLVMGRPPKDFDIATDARPEEVRAVFGQRRTLAVGESFGVIVVLGPRDAEPVEVATFRRDLGYSDGRHPDSVAFATPEEDARRRDFTINGLFLDPQTNAIIDFVGGQEDIQHGLIRAIGDPAERFGEDKLRMLRAVRFAATLDFRLDPGTRAEIQRRTQEIRLVSVERVTAELRSMWTDRSRRRAMELLHETGLLAVLFPEMSSPAAAAPDSQIESRAQVGPVLTPLFESCSRLQSPEFMATMALIALHSSVHPAATLDQLAAQFKLTRREHHLGRWIVEQLPIVRAARIVKWPKLQRVLVHPDARTVVAVAEAYRDTLRDEVAFCREKLLLAASDLNPNPLLSGRDLQQLGIPPGPIYSQILESLRDAQLDGEIDSREQALEWARTIAAQASHKSD